MQPRIAWLLNVLYGHHRQVVALLRIAHKLTDGFFHQADKLSRFLFLLGKRLSCHLADTLHAELFLVGIHSLGQSVGKEEDGGSREDMCLLQSIFPRRSNTYG